MPSNHYLDDFFPSYWKYHDITTQTLLIHKSSELKYNEMQVYANSAPDLSGRSKNGENPKREKKKKKSLNNREMSMIISHRK
jgi:hypothetical protein